MKLIEATQLIPGTPVWINEGNGWRRQAKFIRLVDTIKFKRTTISELMSNGFDLGKGRKTKTVDVEYIDDNGKTVRVNVDPRKLSRRFY